MNLLEKHFRQTEKLIKSIDSAKIVEWLLNSGYYPEQYVFPPNFKTINFKLKASPYYAIKLKREKHKFSPKLIEKEILNISYPKTELTDRIFGIYHPMYYHDIVWYLNRHLKQIINHLFPKYTKIFSYSFPIPVNENNVGSVGTLRSGRMIYEYLELAEKDLLAESYKYKILLKTDIKNFYPSVYTHTIAWALHTKEKIRNKNERNLRFCGNIFDVLIQYANDRKTNGIPIGPALSDLIAEILLASIDVLVSKKLRKEDFIAARYKDDYFFLINNEDQAKRILKVLQNTFKQFNLFINEEKTEKYALPDGLLRPWMLEFNKIWNSIKPDETKKLSFKNFLMVTQEVLKIDSLYPGTGTIDKYLSKLVDKNNNYSLHISFNNVKNKKQAVLRTFSLLIHLSLRSKKSFPAVLGVIESIIRAPNSLISKSTKDSLISEMQRFSKNLESSPDEHKKLWWIYFVLSNSILKSRININGFYKNKTPFLDSYKKGDQKFFEDFSDCALFEPVTEKIDFPISRYLDVFNRNI